MMRASNMVRRGILVGIGWLLMAVALACTPSLERNPNEDSGNDGERGRAQLMELNVPVNDNVSYIEYDMTDWKYFQIPAPGTIRLTLGCDYGGAACVAVVRDEVGQLVRRVESGGEPRVHDTLTVRRGNYYLEVFAQAAATDYTVQVDYEPN